MKQIKSSSVLLALSLLLPACGEQTQKSEPVSRTRAALSDENAIARWQLVSKWETGYCANVTVENRSHEIAPFWTVKIDLKGTALTQVWDAEESPDYWHVFTPKLQNAALAPNGGSTSFGFCASREPWVDPPQQEHIAFVGLGAPSDNPRPAPSLRLDSNWNSGYCATVTVRNASPQPMYGWTVRTRLNQSSVTQLWGGSHSVAGGVLTVQPQTYNSTLAPNGGSTSFGFCANKTGSNYQPASCPLHPSDLSVHYIEHTPRFSQNYICYTKDPEQLPWPDPPCLNDGYIPYDPTPSEKTWPNPGEVMTYKAHVENQGSAASPAVAYRWLIDDVEVRRGVLPALATGAYAEPQMQWIWKDGDHTVRFELMGSQCPVVDDGHVANNAREQRTNAVLFTVYSFPGFETWMAEHDNAVGTRSAADWIQLQADEMNRLFAINDSELAPDGVLLRIGIDRVVRVSEWSEVPPGGQCPTDSCYALVGTQENSSPEHRWWLEYINGRQHDTITLHEWGHQIGLMDVYNLDTPFEQVLINNGIPGAVGNSNSLTGDFIEKLFDGNDSIVPAAGPAPVWYAVEFATPRSIDSMRMRFDYGTHRWQVVSSDTLESAIAGTPPAEVREWVLTYGSDFHQIDFPATVAKVWLVNAEQLDSDQIAGPAEWEFYDGGEKVDVLALIRSARVAGTPLMPLVKGYEPAVHMNSTSPNDLMGGGTPFQLTPYHQWALNLDANWQGRGLPLRRGWFGRYLHNIPADNSLLIRRDGAPLAGATVEVIQRQDNIVRDIVKFSGTTDSAGRFDFPKQSTSEYARYYGLDQPLSTPNPFTTTLGEYPDVIGTNAVLVFRITDGADEQVYKFLDVIQFNLEYARGNVEQGTYVIDVGAEP